MTGFMKRRIINKYPWCSGIDIDLERGGELANRTKANALFSRIYSTVKAKGASIWYRCGNHKDKSEYGQSIV